MFGSSRALNLQLSASLASESVWELALRGVDPGEGDYEPDHPEEEQKLHPDRQPDQAPCPPRPGAAALAVGGVRDEFRPAGVASDLRPCLLHLLEYVHFRTWNSKRSSRRPTPCS